MKRDRRYGTGHERLSRRDAFKAAAAIAAAPFLLRDTLAAQRPPVMDDAGTLDRAWREAPTSRQPILLKGGTIVSMDPKVGDFAKGDVLIEGKKIVAVGAPAEGPATGAGDRRDRTRSSFPGSSTRIAIRGKGSFAASFPTAPSPSTWRRRTTGSRATIVRTTSTSAI